MGTAVPRTPAADSSTRTARSASASRANCWRICGGSAASVPPGVRQGTVKLECSAAICTRRRQLDDAADKTRSRSPRPAETRRSHAAHRSGPRSAALEGAGLALFGEGAGGFLEVLRQVKLQRRGLHRHFALELVHVPAAGADPRANRGRGGGWGGGGGGR